MVYTLRYSQKGSVIKWDNSTFTDCRPNEADGITDEIVELAEALNVAPVLLKDVSTQMPFRHEQIIDWPLEKANIEARQICSKALCWAQGGFDNLKYAKDVYNEYKEEGLLHDTHHQQIDLDKQTKRKPWDKTDELDSPIGFGDEAVTDANLENNHNGTVTYKVRTMHFADPYGCECFNVVELVIKVEVVPFKIKQKNEVAGQKRKSDAVSPKKK